MMVISRFARQINRSEIPSPTFAVFSWELRRNLRNRLSWVLALLVFGLIFLVSWMVRQPIGVGFRVDNSNGDYVQVGVPIHSAWGLTLALATPLLTLFVIAIPFISSDSITLDVKRRTHEIVMSSRVSSTVYIVGRYLAVLILNLAMSLLLLVAIVFSTILTSFSTPDFGLLLKLWVLMVLPSSILICSLSFTLGCVLPRYAVVVNVLVIFIWIGLNFFSQSISHTGTSSTYDQWEPTAIGMAQSVNSHYQTLFFHDPVFIDPQSGYAWSDPAPIDPNRALEALAALQRQPPDLSDFVLPRLALILLGLMLPLIAILAFRRFNNA